MIIRQMSIFRKIDNNGYTGIYNTAVPVNFEGQPELKKKPGKGIPIPSFGIYPSLYL